MGRRTDPCGTPMDDRKVGDLELPIETNCRRLERYDRTYYLTISVKYFD